MAKRERVASASFVTDASQLSTPWANSAATPAATDDVPEQYTEVAAYARSPSPVPEGVDEATDEAAGRVGQHVSKDAGPQKMQAAGPRDSSAQQSHVQPQQLHPLRPGTAEVIMSGELTGAVGFGHQSLHCTWQLVYDQQVWQVTQGLTQGRTHASSPLLPEDGSLSGVVWELPLKFAFMTSTIQHWPQIVFKLFRHDVWLGRDVFLGYSLCNLPNTPGSHHISCPVWSPVEARRSFGQELISWFTGLTPQLVDETFITDLEQRYEQGQHLHTRDCSSISACPFLAPYAPTTVPSALAVESCSGLSNTGGNYCRSFSTSGAGGAAAAGPAGLVGGGRICLRLHVVARGLSQLKVVGGDSVGRALEKLRDTVGLMRKQQDLKNVYDEEEEESEGVRLVREGRAARLAAAREHVDGVRDRDQQQAADSNTSTYPGSPSRRASNLTTGRASPSRNSRLHSGAFSSSGSNMTAARQSEATRGEANLGGTESPPRLSRVGRLGTSSLAGTNTTRQQSPAGRLSSNSARTGSGSPGSAGIGRSAANPGISGRSSGLDTGDSNQQERVLLQGRGSLGEASELSARLPPSRFEQQNDE